MTRALGHLLLVFVSASSVFATIAGADLFDTDKQGADAMDAFVSDHGEQDRAFRKELLKIVPPAPPAGCAGQAVAWSRGFRDGTNPNSYLYSHRDVESVTFVYLGSYSQKEEGLSQAEIDKQFEAETDGGLGCGQFLLYRPKATEVDGKLQVTQRKLDLPPEKLAERERQYYCCAQAFKEGNCVLFQRAITDPNGIVCRDQYSLGLLEGEAACKNCKELRVFPREANCFSMGFIRSHMKCEHKLAEFMSDMSFAISERERKDLVSGAGPTPKPDGRPTAEPAR